MSAFSDWLQIISDQTGPIRGFEKMLTTINGPPNDSSNVRSLFVYDSSADKTYFNRSMVSGTLRPTGKAYVELADADTIAEIP